MIELLLVLASNFAIIMVCMLLLWALSIRLNDVSFIDSFWALGFVIIAAATYLMADGAPPRQQLLLVITAVWGFRLGGYLFWRWRKHGPDPHYVALAKRARGSVHAYTLKSVFLTQGACLWVVSLPVQMGQLDRTPEDLGPLALFGCVLSGIGLAFEAIGDWQMARFRADPVNKGRVINKGLWRNTRHPNYFGDTCVWWGLYLIAAETTTGLFSIPGPILITYLLVGLTGAAMLERNLGDRAHKRASLRPINAIL